MKKISKKKLIIAAIVVVVLLVICLGGIGIYFKKHPKMSKMTDLTKQQGTMTTADIMKMADTHCAERKMHYFQSIDYSKKCNQRAIVPIANPKQHYEVVGKEGGNCHLKKNILVQEPEFKITKLADCRVPMAEYNKVHGLLAQYAEKMCDSNTDNDALRKQAEEIIEKYCKSEKK